MDPGSYERKKNREGKRQQAISESGRDIGDLPKVAKPKRKKTAERNLRLFAETYFPATFSLGWSPDHLRVIEQIEQCVLHGGQTAIAMPRGSGKTSLSEVSGIWAASYGHRDYLALIGSDEGSAVQMLESIKSEFENNELLAEDFPEICYPIQKLEGIAHRCKGQLYKGERTQIGWLADRLILPTIPKSKASGVIIRVAGITGGLRGMKFKRPDGKAVRPKLVIVDDPQTDASARSPSQCEARERILAGAILGLAGPGVKIAAVMPCTVIRPGDVADNILNRDKHPEWHGIRTKLIYKFPTDEKLWEEYGRIRADGLRNGDEGKAATEFYRANRDAMDAGAEVAWPDRHNEDELSALQNAMNLYLADKRAFFAEYQNEPLPEEDARSDELTPDKIAVKLTRRARGVVPIEANRITAFIDVHASLLYWVAIAWADEFTGFIIDYNTWPEQGRHYFTLRDAKRTLATESPNAGLEGQIHAGLEALTDRLLGRSWTREDGAELKIEKCPIDANWGASTDAIYAWCRGSKFASIVMPSHGKYIGAANAPMREWRTTPGDRVGLNWRMPTVAGRRAVRFVVFDSNFWKSFVQTRLATAMGDRGCLSLFGSTPDTHRLISDHLCAEYRTRTEGRGRTVDEWKVKPERPDNHWLDCVVGASVAASILGVTLQETSTQAAPGGRKKVSFRDLQAKRKGSA